MRMAPDSNVFKSPADEDKTMAKGRKSETNVIEEGKPPTSAMTGMHPWIQSTMGAPCVTIAISAYPFAMMKHPLRSIYLSVAQTCKYVIAPHFPCPELL